MTYLALKRAGSVAGIAWLLAACAGLATPPASAPQQDRGSWISSDASKGPLLYATDAADNIVYIVSLPSGRLVGKLTGFDQPVGDCVDVKGDVFIADSQHHQIVAYRHAAREAYEVLSDQGYYPIGCAIDPVTGNLAVANCCAESGSSGGNVAIYAKAKGSAKYRTDASIVQYGFCSYDGHGNLFVDGITRGSYQPQVAELPYGQHAFTNITLDQSLGGQNISGLFWDGEYLAVGSQDSGDIYRFVISGSSGTKVATIVLKDGTWPGGFWIQTVDNIRNLYTPFWENSSAGVGVYPYPKGGRPAKTLYAALEPFAVTVSEPAQ